MQALQKPPLNLSRGQGSRDGRVGESPGQNRRNIPVERQEKPPGMLAGSWASPRLCDLTHPLEVHAGQRGRKGGMGVQPLGGSVEPCWGKGRVLLLRRPE